LLVGILLAAFAVIGWLWFEFRKEAVEVNEKSAVALVDIKAVKAAPVTDDQQGEVRRLKEQLKAAQDKDGANEQVIGDLRGQVEVLKNKVGAVEALSLSENEGKITHLRAENAAFGAQIDVAARQLKDFQEAAVRLENERTRMREEFESVIEQLRAENLQLRAQPQVSESDVQQLKNKIDEFDSKVRELELTNVIQTEKNDYLQYELTKSRAQVVGLERLCGNVPSPGIV